MRLHLNSVELQIRGFLFRDHKAPAKRSNIFVQHRVRHTKRSVAKRANNV